MGNRYTDEEVKKRPYLFQKGKVANPKGRPKGKTMKEFARDFLMAMSDEEKIKFLNSLDSDIIWRMAEGNPSNETDFTSKGEKIGMFLESLNDSSTNSKN